jgi:hypothetical protein
MPGSAGVAPAINPVATASVQANMPGGSAAGPAIKSPVANKSTQTNLNKKPEPPDMDLAIRHIAVAYFFQSGLQLKDICERLDIQKGSLAHMISVIKKRVPDYEAEKDIRVLLAAAPSKSLARAAPYITKSTALPDIRHALGIIAFAVHLKHRGHAHSVDMLIVGIALTKCIGLGIVV